MSVNAIDVRKTQAYAVLESAGDRIGLRKVVAYALMDAAAGVSVQKVVAYAVLQPPDDGGPRRRRLGMPLGGFR